jgi:chromosome segregation ATPase
MHYTLMLFLTLAGDHDALPDSQMAQTVLTEIRALRLDLRNTAATIQRVQIVMYRFQAQAANLERATGRLDVARGQCKQAEEQQKAAAVQIEEMKKQSGQNGDEQKNIQQIILQLRANTEIWVTQAQTCQGEQADAEAQFRVEQAKMSELENQLEQLDRVLADQGRK